MELAEIRKTKLIELNEELIEIEIMTLSMI